MIASCLEKIKKWPWTVIMIAVCLVDVLLFPYIRKLSCSLAMLLVLVWYIAHIRKPRVSWSTVIAIVWIVASLGFGIIWGSTDSLKVGIIIAFAFLFLDLLKQRVNEGFIKKVVTKIFFIYITVVFAFAVLYVLDPKSFFELRSFWTMGNTKIEFHSWMMNRYTFIYSDPNNAGGAFVAILAYTLFCEKHRRYTEAYYILALSLSTVATQSMQALFALFVILAVYAFLLLRSMSVRGRIIAVSFFFVLIAVILAFKNVWIEIDVVKSVLKRLQNSNLSTGGGRMSFWQATIQNAFSWYNLIIGKGGVVDAAGKVYLPHSGFLYMTISYGFITLVMFIKSFFILSRKSKPLHYLVFLPLLIIFSINTGVIDYRFLCTLTMLSAFVYLRAWMQED